MTDTTCTPERCVNPGPRGGSCRACVNARALRSYYANREERLAYNKQWREANPERVKANLESWFQRNADHRQTYLDEHREEMNAKSRARRAANPGANSEYSRKWRKENPERWALRNRENSRRRQAGHTASRVAYKSVLERDGMICHLCGDPIPSLADLHFDHVIPLAKGGPHSAENIKPAHALCNMRKSDKIL